jgi:hypothetical protein
VAPFTVVDCGLPLGASWVNCELHAFARVEGTLAPADASEWRGSTTFLPLPGSRTLALGMVHQRTSKADFKWHEIYKDRYTHRFVLIDTENWRLIGFSDPFAFFANFHDVEWFEFVMGMAIFGQKELVITFGFNDQEPWMAIVPIQLAVRSLRPVQAIDQVQLDRLAKDWGSRS